MQRMKTKLSDDLSASLRGLAAVKKKSMQEYCTSVIDTFVHGAVLVAQNAASADPVIKSLDLNAKCVCDLDLYLSDAVDFDTFAGVHGIALLSKSTPSEVIRSILSAHVWGAGHAVNLRLPALQSEGINGGKK